MKISNEDNMVLMSRYEDNYFDLAIVDPPYGLGKRTTDGGSKKNTQTKFMDDIRRSNWDDTIPTDDYFNELFRVSKKQIIWGGNYFPYIWKNGCRGLITWDKMVYIPTMSQIEFAWYSEDKLPKLVKINNNDSNRLHPTQKPIEYLKGIIELTTNEEDVVLDDPEYDVDDENKEYELSSQRIIIKTCEDVTGKTAMFNQLPEQPGDVPKTYSDITKAKEDLDYEPKTNLFV